MSEDPDDIKSQCHALVYDHFKNLDKTMLWFESRNPLLANWTPNRMLKFKRSETLLRFIQSQLAEGGLTLPL